jgi:hypothetical protein
MREREKEEGIQRVRQERRGRNREGDREKVELKPKISTMYQA